MDPVVASALIAAAATVVGVGGTVAVAIVRSPSSRSANRETIAAAKATTDEAIAAARESSKATIEAAHADVRRTLDTNLPGAILPRADLTGANLRAPVEDFHATLRDANLSDAKLADAHLMKADLTGAILIGANLRRVDLSGAKLVGAILADADLQDAALTRADLRGAALTRADLRGADLTGALWAEDLAAPEGWVRDAGSGRLSRSNATASTL